MKTLHKTLIALAAGAVMTTGAQAAVMGYGSAMTAEPYLGVKVGQYDADGADDAATSFGAYGGAKFTPYFGVEAEYLGTNDADAFQDGTYSEEYNGKVYGLYATYDYAFMTDNTLYGKARLGVAKNEIEIDFNDSDIPSDNGSEDFSDTGIAGSLGLGYNMSPNAALELAYNWYPTIEDDEVDIDVSGVTLGAKFKF